MESKQINITYEKNYKERYSHLDEEMKKKYVDMVEQVNADILKYINLQNQVKTDILIDKEERNIINKQIKELRKVIKNGEYVNDFEDYKLLIDYFYNEKSNKLIINNLYLYKKNSSTKTFSKIINNYKADGLFYVIVLLMFLFIHFSQGYLSKNLTLLWIFFGLYVISGGIFLTLRYKIIKTKKIVFRNYSDVELGNYDFYNLQRYISKEENQVSGIKLIYLISQFILVQVSLLQPIPNQWWLLIVIIIAFITDLYFFKNLLSILFEFARVNSTFFILLLVATFVLGWIDKNTWVAVALGITMISLLVSEDMWNLFQEDSPLSGRYNTKSNQNIVKKNILILKIEINLYVLVLYLIVNYLGDEHYSLDFFNWISSTENKICISSPQAKLLDGFDKLFLAFLLYSLYFIFDKKIKKHFKNPISYYAKELVRPLFSKIYKGIQKKDLEVIDDYGNLSSDNINRYPELIIRDSKYIPEETKLLFENDNGNNILKIIYPNKEVEIRKITSFEKSKENKQ